MRQLRVYIAGKVTGLDYQQTFDKFARIEQTIRELGHETVNPMRLVGKHIKDWQQAMKICLPEMLTCDAIYLIHDWSDSRGARLEYLMANELGFRLLTDNHLLEMRQQLQRHAFNCRIA